MRNEESHTVRLPRGLRNELVAATGIGFSTLVRSMCEQLLALEKAKKAKMEKGND